MFHISLSYNYYLHPHILIFPELDDGKLCRTLLYLMLKVKRHGFLWGFPLKANPLMHRKFNTCRFPPGIVSGSVSHIRTGLAVSLPD